MEPAKHKRLLEIYLVCLDEKRFFDAHEALEEIWFPRRFEDDSEIKLLKGFINAAVSFELLLRGREEASTKVWSNYLKYKPLLQDLNSEFTPMYHKISIHIQKIHTSCRKN